MRYDEGYRDREASRGEYTSSVERISAYMSSLYNYYLEEFGLCILYNEPRNFESLADQCPAGRDNLCNCGTCVETDENNPAETVSTMHHKNMKNVLYNLDVNPADTYTMVFIGHPLCEKKSGNTCAETDTYGVNVNSLKTSAIFTYDDTAFEHMTVFHEFGHLVGAPDHYGSNGQGTSWYQTQYDGAGFDRNCMYGERGVYEDYENHTQVVESRIVCDGCKSFIRGYLSDYFA